MANSVILNLFIVVLFLIFSKVTSKTIYNPSRPLNSRSVVYPEVEVFEEIPHQIVGGAILPFVPGPGRVVPVPVHRPVFPGVPVTGHAVPVGGQVSAVPLPGSFYSHVQEHQYSKDSKQLIVPTHHQQIVGVPIATRQVIPLENQQGVIPHQLHPIEEEHHHAIREERQDVVKRPLAGSEYVTGGGGAGTPDAVLERDEEEKTYRRDSVRKPIVTGGYRYL